MTRKALIIVNPGGKGDENYTDGVYTDAENYKKYLLSYQGGSWYEREIVISNQPNKAQVDNEINLMEATDYTFIVFSGHGCISQYEDTVIELKPGHDYKADRLKIGAKKRTIILDCCRKKHHFTAEELVLLEKRIVHDSFQANAAENSRKKFENLVANCPNSIVEMFSCNYDEVSYDDSRFGGLYSHSLLKAASNDLKEGYYRSVVNVHNAAISNVRTKSGNMQNPQISKPKSEPYFPFTVK